jgi:urea transport system substrate-binding protein
MTHPTISRRGALKLGTAAAAGALATPFLGRSGLAAEEPIKLGSLLDGSGALGLEGKRMIETTEYAVELLNKAGGLLGRPIKIIAYDTQSSMQLYTQYAQQLALKEKVDVIQGGITSASREAIRPIFGRSKTLYFYNTQYEGGVCDRNVFCTGTTPAQTVNHIVDYALKTWGKKAYIVAADYNYGHITASWMTKFMKEGGGSVAGTDFFPLDVTNFSSAISRIQQAQPDLVLSALVGANHSGFYRQWDAAGMKGRIPLGSSVFGLGDELTTMDASTTNGIVTCYGWYNDLPDARSVEFVKGMQAKFGADVTDLSELDTATYDGIMLWAEGVRKAGSLDRDKVIAALESGISYEGPTGKVTMDGATHHTTRSTYLARPKDKKWEILASFPDQFPADTAGACDLLKNPKTNKQFTPDLKG